MCDTLLLSAGKIFLTKRYVGSIPTKGRSLQFNGLDNKEGSIKWFQSLEINCAIQTLLPSSGEHSIQVVNLTGINELSQNCF